MQEHKQKYIWGFWIISFVITSIFYMGCSGEEPFGNKEEIAGQMSLALQQKDMYCQKKLDRIDSIRNFLNVNEKRGRTKKSFRSMQTCIMNLNFILSILPFIMPHSCAR